MYNSLIKILYISICLLAINNISLCYDACYSCIRFFFGIGTFSTHALSSFFLINDANTVRLNYADIIRHRGSPYDNSNGARIRVAIEIGLGLFVEFFGIRIFEYFSCSIIWRI